MTDAPPQPPLPRPPRASELLARAGARKLLFVFDFDGTLVHLASRPELIVVPEALKDSLARAASRHLLAICTGRAVKDVLKFLPDEAHLDVIGNHGLEWRLASPRTNASSAAVWRDLTPAAWEGWRPGFMKELSLHTLLHGGEIEDKRSSLSLHYRNSGMPYWTSSEGIQWLRGRLAPGVADLLEGKAVWNILPAGASKGVAIVRYAREFGIERIVFFGDEPTDESVFARREIDLVGVRVGEGPTAASFRVPDVEAAREWLAELAKAE